FAVPANSGAPVFLATPSPIARLRAARQRRAKKWKRSATAAGVLAASLGALFIATRQPLAAPDNRADSGAVVAANEQVDLSRAVAPPLSEESVAELRDTVAPAFAIGDIVADSIDSPPVAEDTAETMVAVPEET